MAQSSCQLRSRPFCFLSIILVLISSNFCLAREIKAITWNPATETSNLLTYLKTSGKFTTTLSLLQKVGPSGTLSGVQAIQSYLQGGPMTFFFPLDSAYAKLDAPTKNRLGDFTTVQALLQFQAVQTRLTAANLNTLKRGGTMSTRYKAQTIQKNSDGLVIVLNPVGSAAQSTVTAKEAYVSASHIVHGIDTVLLPKM